MMLISATLCQFMSEESPTSFTGAPLSISWAMALVSASRFASEASITSCRTSWIFSRSRLAALCWDRRVCSVQEKTMDMANARITIRSSQRRKVFEMVLFLMCLSFSFLIFSVCITAVYPGNSSFFPVYLPTMISGLFFSLLL